MLSPRATREDRSLLPGTEARPADVLIPNWTGGDMTVINPLQTQLVRQAATKAGAALDTAYRRNMTQAGETCRREGMVFVQMPWETHGLARGDCCTGKEAGLCPGKADWGG
jgi:hypothetical protein